MSDLPSPPPTPKTPIFHLAIPGRLLGESGDEANPYFGIWDTRHPGPPVERFERTEDGWKQATKRLARMGKGHAPAPLHPTIACPTCGVKAVVPITSADKFGSALMIGVYAIGKMGKSFSCFNCGYSW